jgi:(E)-2-((N-methylformamido)methylene)succinate hydrolase
MSAVAAASEGSLAGTRFRASGNGAPLILIHGVGLDLEIWEPLAERLAANRRLIRYDMLGHGASAKPAGPYALADFTRQLGRLLEDLGLEAADLAGFSMGGMVAQGFALEAPGRVRRLVLLNTVFDRSPEARAAIEARLGAVSAGGYAAGVEAAIERWFTPEFRAREPECVEAVRRRLAGNDLAAYAAAYAVFATADRELADAVGRIAAPTLVATGAEDQHSTTAMAEALAARLRYGVCRILEGQRHMTPLEAPDRLAGMIEEFLATPALDGAPVA